MDKILDGVNLDRLKRVISNMVKSGYLIEEIQINIKYQTISVAIFCKLGHMAYQRTVIFDMDFNSILSESMETTT